MVASVLPVKLNRDLSFVHYRPPQKVMVRSVPKESCLKASLRHLRYSPETFTCCKLYEHQSCNVLIGWKGQLASTIFDSKQYVIITKTQTNRHLCTLHQATTITWLAYFIIKYITTIYLLQSHSALAVYIYQNICSLKQLLISHNQSHKLNYLDMSGYELQALWN